MTMEELQEEVATFLCAAAMWSAEDRMLAAEILKAMRGDDTSECYGAIGVVIRNTRRFMRANNAD